MSDSKNERWHITPVGSWVNVFVKGVDGNLSQVKQPAVGKIIRGVLIEKGLPMPEKRTISLEEAVAAEMEVGDCAVLNTEQQAEDLKNAMEEMNFKGKEFQYIDHRNASHWRVFRVE